MIEFTVLGGYLGSGKTTLLNHLLTHNQGRRFALLINDFGAINIDAELVESQNESQINLANGCVCCTLSDGFFEALETLKALEPPPDHIIVEASGVADVHNLGQYGHGQGLQLAGIVVLADAETIRQKANDKYVAQTVRRQLQAADIIVLNKTDLCSPEQLAATARWLAELAPNTPLIQTSRGRVPLSILLSIRPGPRPDRHLQHQDHEQYTSWSWQASYPITRHQLEQFLHHLPDSTIRAKGLFASATGDTLELQAVGGRREIYQRPEVRAGCELVAIGLSGFMQPQALDRLASRFLSSPS